jgi:hypothetical protein
MGLEVNREKTKVINATQSGAAIDNFVQKRLIQFLKHRNQRPFKPPEGMSWYTLIYKELGVIRPASRENLQ